MGQLGEVPVENLQRNNQTLKINTVEELLDILDILGDRAYDLMDENAGNQIYDLLRVLEDEYE